MVDIAEAKRKILAHNRVNQYVDITPYELHVGFPIINYTGFFPQPNELIIYAVPASIFKDKEQVVGYTGKSAGASFRVAKGVTVRTGGSGGRAVRDTVRKHSFGDLIITNQRVIFIGKDDNFDFPINKITAIKPLSKETFVIQAGRSSKNIFVESGAVLYAAGFVNYAITCYNEGLDVNAEKKQAEDEMTSEQRELCDIVLNTIVVSEPIKTQNTKITQLKKIPSFIFGIILSIIYFILWFTIGFIESSIVLFAVLLIVSIIKFHIMKKELYSSKGKSPAYNERRDRYDNTNN